MKNEFAIKSLNPDLLFPSVSELKEFDNNNLWKHYHFALDRYQVCIMYKKKRYCIYVQGIDFGNAESSYRADKFYLWKSYEFLHDAVWRYKCICSALCKIDIKK